MVGFAEVSFLSPKMHHRHASKWEKHERHTIYVQRSGKNRLLYKPTSCYSFTLVPPTSLPHRSYLLCNAIEKQCKWCHNLIVIAVQQHSFYEVKCTIFIGNQVPACCLPIEIDMLSKDSIRSILNIPQSLPTRNKATTKALFQSSFIAFTC